jgi:hypothetical protein
LQRNNSAIPIKQKALHFLGRFLLAQEIERKWLWELKSKQAINQEGEEGKMLTLEFAIELTREQEEIVSRWMDLQKLQWNIGLGALLEFDSVRVWNKPSKAFVPRCVISGDWVKGAGALQCCPVRGNLDLEPRIKAPGIQSAGGLGVMSRGDNVPEVLHQVPYKFRFGTLALLAVSWERYKSDPKNVGEPRFKRMKDSWDVLYTGQGKDTIGVGSDGLRIPFIGWVPVPGLDRRWREPDGSIPEICAFKIVRRGQKFRCQLTGALNRVYKAKPTSKAVGIDLGFVYAHIESSGTRTALLSLSEERLEAQKHRLQRKLDAKLDHRLILWLHHPSTDIDSLWVERVTKKGVIKKPLIRISLSNWKLLKECRTAGEVAQVIGQKGDRRFQALRHGLPKSVKESRLKEQIANIDRRLAKTRKVRDEKLATRLAKNYGYIAIENGLQREDLRHRPEPVQLSKESWAKNGAERQSLVNNQMKSLAPGRKIAQIEAMAKRYGREFSRQEAPTTSTECPCCGAQNDPGLHIEENGDRLYRCDCGWICDRDINAGVNIELRAFALKPEVRLTAHAENARVRSYQLEAAGRLVAEPKWRTPPEPPSPAKEPRSKRRKGSTENSEEPKPKKQRLSPASRKSQLKALAVAGGGC